MCSSCCAEASSVILQVLKLQTFAIFFFSRQKEGKKELKCYDLLPKKGLKDPPPPSREMVGDTPVRIGMCITEIWSHFTSLGRNASNVKLYFRFALKDTAGLHAIRNKNRNHSINLDNLVSSTGLIM